MSINTNDATISADKVMINDSNLQSYLSNMKNMFDISMSELLANQDTHDASHEKLENANCELTDLGPNISYSGDDGNDDALVWLNSNTDTELSEFIKKYGFAILAGIFLTVAFAIPYFSFRSIFKNFYLKSIFYDLQIPDQKVNNLQIFLCLIYDHLLITKVIKMHLFKNCIFHSDVKI